MWIMTHQAENIICINIIIYMQNNISDNFILILRASPSDIIQYRKLFVILHVAIS